MVISPFEKVCLRSAGKPKTVTSLSSVTPMVRYVISVIAVFTQTVWLFVPGAEVREMSVLGCTVMVPLAVTFPQPPVKITV